MSLVAGAFAWARAERARIERAGGPSAALLEHLVRRRLGYVAAVGAVVGGALAVMSPTADQHLFDDAARSFLSGGWADSFADPRLQLGPAWLVVLAVGHLAGRMSGLPAPFVVGAVAGAGLVVATVCLSRAAAGRRGSLGDVSVAAAAVVLGVPVLSITSHQEEAAVALLLVAATLAAATRGVAASLMVGVATAVKAWAGLGVPLLVRRGDVAGSARRCVLAVAVAVLGYLPFWVAGSVRSAAMVWRVEAGSSLSTVIAVGTPFGATGRLVQVAVVAGLATALSWSGRTAGWAMVAAVMAARLLLDPLDWSYYWAALVFVLLVGLRAADDRGRRRIVVPLGAAAVLAVWPLQAPGAVPGWLTASAAALTLASVLVAGRSADPRPTGVLAAVGADSVGTRAP